MNLIKQKKNKRKLLKFHLINLLQIIIGGLILSGAAIYNKYPLVAPDSATYIISAFKLELNDVDAIMYSFFIRLFSFNNSLWAVIFTQSFLFSFILYKFIKLFEKININKIFFLIILFISFFTGVSWYSSMIMTDIFTGIAFMAMLIIYFKKKLNIFELFSFSIIIIFSILTHKSHFILFPFLIISAIIIFYLVNKNIRLNKRIFVIIALIILSWPLNIIINHSLSGEAEMKSSSHIFIVARLNQTNMLKKVLDEYCDEKDFCICEYKDELPVYRGVFKWDKEKSPVYKCGAWEGTKKEFKEIIKLSFSTPKLVFWHISDAMQATFEQLIQFRVGRLFSNQSKGYASESINKYFNSEYSQFLTSKQNIDTINFYAPSNRQSLSPRRQNRTTGRNLSGHHGKTPGYAGAR